MTNYEHYQKTIEKEKTCAGVWDLLVNLGELEPSVSGPIRCSDRVVTLMAWASEEYEAPEPVPELKKITYIEHNGHYSFIHYMDGSVRKVRLTQSRLEEMLEPFPQFVTINNGIVVNLTFALDNDSTHHILNMWNGDQLPISRRMQALVDNTWNEFKGGGYVMNHQEKPDMINHPSHYCRDGGMESIDEMVEVFGVDAVMSFCLCNVWKYRYRASGKNGEEDLKKSDWYMRKYLSLKGKNDD